MTFKLTYEGREIVTFPVKNTGYLISQVIPPSVLIFTKFVVISLSTPTSIMELPTSLKTFLLQSDCSIVFLPCVQ